MMEPCGHPCKCHAINENHICDAPRTGGILAWYEEDALVKVYRKCGQQALIEMVNRLLMATAEHQHASGFDAGRLHGIVDAEIAVEAALKNVLRKNMTKET